MGTLRKAKDPSKDNYIAVEKGVNIVLKEGDVLSVQDPRKKLDKSVAAGRMTKERAEEIKAKIPDYIIREIYLAPPK